MEDPAMETLAGRFTASPNGVDVRRRQVMVKPNVSAIRSCFAGSDAVAWIIKDTKISRKQAEAIAESMRQQMIFKNVYKVHKDSPFVGDKYTFYKFKRSSRRTSLSAPPTPLLDASSTLRFYAQMKEGATKLHHQQQKEESPTISKITVSYVMREVAKGNSPMSCVGRALAGVAQDWLVFINRNSGGKAGPVLLDQIRGLLPEQQIVDLVAERGPEKGLTLWAKEPLFRLLVCGGDGTLGWVLSQIDKKIGTRKDLPWPIVGIIPLGTGNDMSRACGWGASYSGVPLTDLLSELDRATPQYVDRWKIECVEPERDPQRQSATNIFHYEMRRGATEVALRERAQSVGVGKETAKAIKMHRDTQKRAESVLNNYFSIGVDAEIVLGFHEMREEHQGLFQGVLVNKGWYAGFSAKAALPRLSQGLPTRALHKHIILEIDGEEVHIPKRIRGLVVTNLPTYGGGNLWGKRDKGKCKAKAKKREKEREAKFKAKEKAGVILDELEKRKATLRDIRERVREERKEQWRDPALDDGLLEVVGLTGVAHLGAITTGVAHGKRLGQGRIVQITSSTTLPVQVDGEPWRMIPCRVTITHHNRARLLVRNNTSNGFHKDN